MLATAAAVPYRAGVLLRADGDAVVAIGQPAHAWLSGQLARAWGNPRMGPVEPWEEVCLAAEQHDIGMAEWDLAPSLNPGTGRPHGFTEMPLDVHLALWRAAPARLLAQSRYAAVLVSMHGEALYRMRDIAALPAEQAAAVRGYLAEQEAFQAEWLGALRADEHTAPHAAPRRVRRNQRLLWTWDFLSLALCLDWPPVTARDVPTAAGAPEPLALAPVPGSPATFTLDPWPFVRERVELRTEGRRLVGRFDDAERMRAALGAAPWTTLRFALRAASA
jgi:hypothetical protein